MRAPKKKWCFHQRRLLEATGQRKQSSVEDEAYLIATIGALLLGHIPGGGITDALPADKIGHAKRLLESNVPLFVPSRKTLKCDRAWGRLRTSANEALAAVSRIYLQEHHKLGVNALCRTRLADWMASQLDDKNSAAWKKLHSHTDGRFNALLATPMAPSWWYRLLKPD